MCCFSQNYENPMTPGNCGIMGIPTVIYFKEGKIVDRIVGVAPQSHLEELVERALRQGHRFGGIRSDGEGASG